MGPGDEAEVGWRAGGVESAGRNLGRTSSPVITFPWQLTWRLRARFYSAWHPESGEAINFRHLICLLLQPVDGPRNRMSG